MENRATEKPRVCMIVQQPDVRGGIAAVTNGYYNSPLENKFNIRYIESYCDGSFIKKLTKALRAYHQFYRLLGDFNPEIVHIHSSFGASFYRLRPFLYMAKKKNIPVIDHCHGADFGEFYTRASDRKKRSIRKVFGSFDRVIVLSREWKKTMEEIVDENRLAVVENFCRPQPEEEIFALTDARFENRQVLFLGELGKRKGGYDFADIADELSNLLSKVKLVFGGSGTAEDTIKIIDSLKKLSKYEVLGEEKSDCSKKQPTEQADKKVGKCQYTAVFPGWVRGDGKDRLLKESSVFILPSYQEGLPMSILDAMAYGLPIVSTDIGGIPQLVHDGENGFLHKPGDTKAAAAAIAELLSDRDLYAKASAESLRIAKDSFSFEAHAEKLSKVYYSVLDM